MWRTLRPAKVGEYCRVTWSPGGDDSQRGFPVPTGLVQFHQVLGNYGLWPITTRFATDGLIEVNDSNLLVAIAEQARMVSADGPIANQDGRLYNRPSVCGVLATATLLFSQRPQTTFWRRTSSSPTCTM